jgi:biopolymer transport protein TolR
MGASVTSSDNSGGGKRRKRRSKRARPMSEINVTPFVDVMLVLLIIFMVAAPLLTVGVPVELPETAAEALPETEEEPLTVTLTADARILIQTTEVDPTGLIPQLQAVAAERNSDRIFLRADGGISYESVMQIMGALNAGGFRNIGLVTDTGGPRLDGTLTDTDN